MVSVETVLGPDRAQALADRIRDEPEVAFALHTLLDHADLLAMMVSGLDGLISRGDTITDSLAESVRELSASAKGGSDVAQLVATARQLGALAPLLQERLPLLEKLLASDRVHALAVRIDEPEVTTALHTLLDHADLLAMLVSGLDGLISRGDTITDSLAESVRELRFSANGGSDVEQLVTTASRLGALAPALRARLPLLEKLLTSDALSDVRLVDVIAAVSTAVTRGAEEAQESQARVKGVMALLRALKDDDVSRALGFLVSVARVLGQELDRQGGR